ncbi:MAG: hypothetical protein ACMX3H_06755 [Sodalis sp. (in: enterobacteria)]
MEHILTGPYNKASNNSRRPPRGAYTESRLVLTLSGNSLQLYLRLPP